MLVWSKIKDLAHLIIKFIPPYRQINLIIKIKLLQII